MEWPLQDAKRRFAEVVRRARSDGPQTVTVRGERAAVVVSAEEFDAMRPQQPTVVDMLLRVPLWDDELVATVSHRAKAPIRDPAF